MLRMVGLMLLTGCSAPLLPGAPGSESGPDTCGRAGVMPLIGQPVSALPAAGGWATLRVIRPGDAVTEDYSTSRLNVELDGQDRILRPSCG